LGYRGEKIVKKPKNLKFGKNRGIRADWGYEDGKVFPFLHTRDGLHVGCIDVSPEEAAKLRAWLKEYIAWAKKLKAPKGRRRTV
jgi:hypothetical protein